MNPLRISVPVTVESKQLKNSNIFLNHFGKQIKCAFKWIIQDKDFGNYRWKFSNPFFFFISSQQYNNSTVYTTSL